MIKSTVVTYVILVIMGLVRAVIVVMITILLLFHVYMKWHGMTTYEYIKRKRDRKLANKVQIDEEKGTISKVNEVSSLGSMCSKSCILRF